MSIPVKGLGDDGAEHAGRAGAELRAILQLCWPTCSCSMLLFLLQFVNILGAGRLGTRSLAAVSLANSYFNIVVYCLMGAGTAIDTSVSQAFGRGKPAECRAWLVRSLLVFAVACVPFCGLLAAAGAVFSGIGIAPDVAEPAAAYIVRTIPGVPCLAVFVCFQKYQQAMNIMGPSLLALALGNVCNFALTFQAVAAGSILDLAWSLSCVRLLLMVSILASERFAPQGSDVPPPQQRLCDWRLLRWFLGLCLSGAAMQGLEAMAFELTVLAAATQGQVPLDAQNLLLQIIALIYLSMPLGISVAATIRVGNLLGAGQAGMARLSSRLCICIGTLVMMGSAIFILRFRHTVATIFTSSPDVVDLVAKLAPIVACFQMIDGFQGVSGGVLRAMGKQNFLAVTIFVAFYMISTPLGFFLCFTLRWGIAGLWYGLACGLGLMAMAYGVKIFMVVDWRQESLLAQMSPTSTLQDSLLDIKA